MKNQKKTKKHNDYLFWCTFFILIFAYIAQLLLVHPLALYPQWSLFALSIYDFINTMWWGIALSFFL